MSMAGHSKNNVVYIDAVEDIYNKHYQYVWRTSTYALPMSTVDILRALCTGKWGYYFDSKGDPIGSGNLGPHYMDSIMCLTFELEEDMVQAKLSLSFKN